MLDITSFKSLINIAKQQDHPSKFLIAFIEVKRPQNYTIKQAEDYLAGSGGILSPLKLVEIEPTELDDLNSLAEKSLSPKKNWKIALIGCLQGSNGQLPSNNMTRFHKKSMIDNIKSGTCLSNYMAFHKNGDLLHLA